MGWMEGEMFAMAYLNHMSFSYCGNEGKPRPIIIAFNHNEHPIGRISGGGDIKEKLKGAPSHPS